jgi:hypothetical protein
MSVNEALIRTVYTVFRPLNEVRWLSRHFSGSTLMGNYTLLTDYCTKEVNVCSDATKECGLKIFSDLKYGVALTVLKDFLG